MSWNPQERPSGDDGGSSGAHEYGQGYGRPEWGSSGQSQSQGQGQQGWNQYDGGQGGGNRQGWGQPAWNGSGSGQYTQNHYGQNPYDQNQYGQNAYGQNPSGQSPYGPGQGPYGGLPLGPNGRVPGRGMSRWGKWMTLGGGVLFVVCVAVGLVLMMTGITGSYQSVRDHMQSVSSGSGTVSLESGTDYQLYYDSTGTAPTCAISGPGSVRAGDVHSTSSASWGSEQWQSLKLSGGSDGDGGESFRVSESGDYTLDCQGSTAVMVSTPITTDRLFQAGFGGILLFLGGGLFFLVLVVGIILWVVGASRVRQARQRF